MAKVIGNSVRVYLRSTDSGTETWLAGELNNSFNLTTNPVDTSDKTNSWASSIAGVKSASCEVTVHADDGETAQTTAISALLAGTEVFARIGGSTGGWDGKFLITSISETNDNGAVASRTLSLQSVGAITHTANAFTTTQAGS